MTPAKSLRSAAAILQLLLFPFFILPFDARAETRCGEIADRISHVDIVWTENAIFVQGTAAPNLSDSYKPVSTIKRETQRAATLEAYRKAAEVLAGVNITGARPAIQRG